MAEGVLHYAVPNMPGAYAAPPRWRLPMSLFSMFVIWLKPRSVGYSGKRPGLTKGIQTHAGYLLCRPVAEAKTPGHSPGSLPQPIMFSRQKGFTLIE